LREHADDECGCDTDTKLDGVQMLESSFDTCVVGTAKSDNAPVHIHVDDDTAAIQRTRTLEHVSTTAAWAQWHCKHVKVAQVILVASSSIQLYLTLIASFSVIGNFPPVVGILPLVSGILGLVSSIAYFTGDVSSLKRTLNWVRLPAMLSLSHCNRIRIDSSFFILDSSFACSSAWCGESS
jgi:hypothetical protein